MELADDISYGVHDLEDGIALNLISKDMWVNDVINTIKDINCDITNNIDFYNEKLFSDLGKDRKHAISKLVGFFISQIEIINQNKFKTPLFDLQAVINNDAKIILKALKNLIKNRVIKSPEVQILEYKGQQIILKIFEVLKENPERLLPRKTFSLYKISENKDRILCDYVSGMTDSYATKLYHKLFTPDTGSIFDRL